MVSLDWQQISAAAAHIRAGRLVAMPTETVFGLAGDATNGAAVAAIFAAKDRPAINPLIAHVPTRAAAEKLAVFSPVARGLADAFWPGPLTLVLPRAPACPVSSLATAGLETIAVRVPDHPVALALLAAVDRPLAAPSANPSGQISPTRAEHVRMRLGARVAMVLEAPGCAIGLESTIVQPLDDHIRVLRPGAVTPAMLTDRTGLAVTTTDIDADAGPVRAPGMLKSHYAPRAPLRKDVIAPRTDEVWLGFGADPETPPAQTLWLSEPEMGEPGDLAKAAATLFAHLHRADALCEAGKANAIAVAPIPAEGLGLAINDRLSRAAVAPTGR
ncbi:MAG: L-threonylcarbamoyladenylate synthase [Pseudomonadota bacterium]